MKVPVEWLHDYLGKKLPARDLAKHLERAGIEVEEIISSTNVDTKVVIGLVKKVIQHPNADRLRLVDVELGNKVLQVVCGAPNVAEGQKVAVALPGAVLPDGTEIKVSQIRGEQSNGMICSQHELGAGNDHSGILVLEPSSQVGVPVRDVMSQGEVIDLTTAANRPDLLSIIGLAREIAAMSGLELKVPSMREVASEGKALKVKLETDKVTRYMLQQFAVDVTHPTTELIGRRLQGVGSRPINAVVDITNFVMHEFGQPLHAFDADKVKLPVSVRMAKKGEKLVTLDGVERKLSSEDMVIADTKGAIALAGVMGGLDTAVTAETSSVLMESATFDAVTVRKTASRHGLRTEASARYERGLPAELAAIGLQRAGDILASALSGTPHSKRFDSAKRDAASRVVKMRHGKLEQVLGIPVPSVVTKERLQRLGFQVSGSDVYEVVVPWWRTDVNLEEDLIEEVGRSIGYDDLPATLPDWRADTVKFDRRYAKLWQLKAALRGLGLFEVVTYSFVSFDQLQGVGYRPAEHLKLKNPLSVEQEYLRSSLLPSLLSVTAKNSRYSSDFGVYEISRIFDAPTDRTKLPAEPSHLAVMRRSAFAGIRETLDLISRQWHVALAVEAAEIVGLHPYRAGRISLQGEMVGVIGEVHPGVVKTHKINGPVSFLELDIDALLAASGDAKYRPVSRYPAITRDIAVVIPDTATWSDVVSALKDYEVEYLNEYRGEDIPVGFRSLAMRLTFVSHERTLKDAEAEAGTAQVLDILQRQFKASLRG